MPDIPSNSSTTTSITIGGTVSSTLDFLGDHDWIRIDLVAGQAVTVLVDGTTLEDPYVYIRNAAGAVLFSNDDINPGVIRDSQVSFTAQTTGTYYIDVGSFEESYTGNYTVTVSNYTPPPLASYDTIAQELVVDYWGAGQQHHFDVTQGGSITVNLTALTAAGKTLARAALAEWTDIIGVNFVEVATGGQITFDDNEAGAATDGSWSNGIATSAHVNVSTQWLAQYTTALNSYSFQTYIHEIGHALGLGHAGYYNGTASYPEDARFENDAWVTSIMSYFDQNDNTYFAGQGFTSAFSLTPMMADIVAMSQMYGLSTTTRTGNTIYGFNSNAGNAVYNAAQNPNVAYCIFDSGGTDTLDYSGFSTNQLINLNPETFSNAGPGVGNVSIARGVVIENAVGGTGNDVLIGNAVANLLTGGSGVDDLSGLDGNDVIDGGAGDDRIDGGAGIDFAVYDSAAAGVSVSLAGSGPQNTSGAGIDTLLSIEAVRGSAFADNLTGGSATDTLYGMSGDDLLFGNAGNDTLAGFAGA
ncbi:MAG: M10 family metallopeptidase C-terminal domain-containing protein, partial [Sphingomicrobium sp.]